MLYNVAPNRPHTKWRWTSAGALVATVLWAIVSLAFSFYTTDFSSYSKTYGAFAGVAILIFWLYLTDWRYSSAVKSMARLSACGLSPTPLTRTKAMPIA